jgi:hypothetical protein
MRRRLAIVLLTLGTIGGYAAGFAGLSCHHQSRRQAFEQHIAQVCVNAAKAAEVPAAPPR